MENRKHAPRESSRKQRHWTEAEARKALAELEASGESTTGFARRRGYSPQRLWWWQKQLGESAPHEASFLPVTVRAVEREAEASLDVCGGLRVELRRLDEASASWVAALARALEAAP